MTGRIIQFGTSRFLQAHVGLFVHEAREAGQAVGPIAVVQTTRSAARAGRVKAFGRAEGYPVVLRGIEKGVPVDRRIDVLSVDRGLSAAEDWAELSALFVDEAEVVISNTGDTGYEIAAVDRGPKLLSGQAPVSFPGILTALLYRRWQEGGRGLIILPCELVNRNGRVLKAAVLDLAFDAGATVDFTEWVEREVIFADTLVDRIVSEPLEPIGAVAEPYALWAIEWQEGLRVPFVHPSVVLAEDLEPFERLKLHILNLGHTALADLWRAQGRAKDETVRALLADVAVRVWLEDLYAREVVPGFVARGMEAEAVAYVATTMDRFLNPYLDHRIADIAQNHATKIERRVAAFLDWSGQAGQAPRLDAIVAGKSPSL